MFGNDYEFWKMYEQRRGDLETEIRCARSRAANGLRKSNNDSFVRRLWAIFFGFFANAGKYLPKDRA